MASGIVIAAGNGHCPTQRERSEPPHFHRPVLQITISRLTSMNAAKLATMYQPGLTLLIGADFVHCGMPLPTTSKASMPSKMKIAADSQNWVTAGVPRSCIRGAS